ncbi:hypothetical protein ABZ897_55945 [Nonomuraea sp. NPDC046802]|uniref:hypothetical protein n=1 Tax=Nonomuraea sp. NPDC046802 TaxID=3154919 RepID=UPI0033C8EE5A
MHNHLGRTLERLARVKRERILPRTHTRLGGVEIEAWTVADDGEPVSARHALGLARDPGRTAPGYRPCGRPRHRRLDPAGGALSPTARPTGPSPTCTSRTCTRPSVHATTPDTHSEES